MYIFYLSLYKIYIITWSTSSAIGCSYNIHDFMAFVNILYNYFAKKQKNWYISQDIDILICANSPKTPLQSTICVLYWRKRLSN